MPLPPSLGPLRERAGMPDPSAPPLTQMTGREINSTLFDEVCELREKCAALEARAATNSAAERKAFTAGWRASRLVKTEFDSNNAIAEAWEGYSTITEALRAKEIAA
tara:strand:- start:862 stop:1182 length:321 start_codon:yes stop_codon:yes gene_type:complete